MSKIKNSSNSQGGSISQIGKTSNSFTRRVEKEIDLDFDEKGFYKRQVKLLNDENGTLVGTHNGDNILLSIEDRDTVEVTLNISGHHNIDHG